MSSNASVSNSAIQRQVVLPVGRSIQIAWQSLRVRFFRSLITTLSLMLAVAFLSYVWVSNDVAAGLQASGDASLQSVLNRAGYDLNPDGSQAQGTPKQRWIVVLSLLVCGVGIVNAQLMAVTERFREIGTMKCLGALDRFVLRLFLLEAGFQGLAGATLGAVAGALLALLGGLWRFGVPAWNHTPLAVVLLSALWSIGVGLLLSLLGVLYPAWVASRMQPVEAMRAEH